MKSSDISLARGLALLGGILALIVSMAQGGEKIYWHFMIKAMITPSQAEEWAWVTFVQMSKEEAFPETAEIVRKMGGEFIGTQLAQVRAAAWRSYHSYEKDRPCREGRKTRPSKIEIFWTSSWSDQVLARCQLLPTDPPTELFVFKFGFCARLARVLMEDGQRRGLDDLDNLIVGPIYLGRGEREEMRGKWHTHAINYEDGLKHYKHCGKSWVEQFDSPLLHYTSDSLRVPVDSLFDREGRDRFGFHGHEILVDYKIIRNNSREHPYWKQKILFR